ncbi:MAG: hypothetical protein PWQ90_1574, partial [Pseudothermotoga sp.]|nr:hypothetical protein [Pseudothermotoga sp.]
SKADSLQIELLSANVVGTAIGMLMLKGKAHYFNSERRSHCVFSMPRSFEKIAKESCSKDRGNETESPASAGLSFQFSFWGRL